MECPICLECDDDSFTKLNCNHMFHTKCIKIWLRNHNTCPYCRTLVNIITVKIKRKTYKMFINPTNIVFKKNDTIISIDFIKIKRIEYDGKKKITIFKKETDDTFSKFKFFSKSGYYIFDIMKQYMS